MPRKPSPPGSIPPKANTKVEKELLRRARAVADYEGKDLFDFLDALLRPEIDQRYHRMIRSEAAAIEDQEESQGGPGTPGGSRAAGRGSKASSA
jgi:hypothetical protein